MSDELFSVVVNDEEQYSLWPAGRALPSGWSIVGLPGPKEQCLLDIEERWTDMRPKSLREAMKDRSKDAL